MSKELESFEDLAIRSRWDAWFETYGVIKDANGVWRGNEQPEALEANYLQSRISDVMEWCQDNDLPARILCLKPRQRGCSTFSTSGLYGEANKKPINAAIIGAKGKQAKNLFKMVAQYSNNDKFPWETRRKCQAASAEFVFPDGQKSEIGILSALEGDPGRSGTYQFLLATEAARWAEDGVANAADVLSGLLKCVQLKSGTTIILETTAAGASGDFYDRWGDALDFEEYKALHEAGELVTGKYIQVFAPWHKFPELRTDLTPEQAYKVERTLGSVERYNSPDFGSEKEIMQRFGLDLAQMAWRRSAIDVECKKDPRVFEQDYPSTWESAFLTSGNRRFNSAGVRTLRKQAKAAVPTWGTIETNKTDRKQMIWSPTDDNEGIIKRWEEPRIGERYLISADVMTGLDQTQGKDPDCHSVNVFKAGRWVEGHGWQKHKIVCRIKGPCRWEVDLLGEWIRRLHYYYTGAAIVIEINNPGLALLMVLKPWNLPIVEREVYDEFEQKFTKQLGFKTTPATKPMVIANLARAIRELETEGDGIEILCEGAVDEINSFIRKPNGTEAAMEGKKDDDVMSIAIGLTMIDSALPYYPRETARALPHDLQVEMELMEQSQEVEYW